MNYLYRFLVLITLTNLIGCASVYRLTPADNSSIWDKGKQYINSEKDSINIWIAFDKVEDRNYKMDLQITNSKDSTILIDPKNFFFVKIDSQEDTSAIQYFNAADPEIKLIKLEKEIESENSSHALSSGLNAALNLTGLIVNIATIGEPPSEESERLNEVIVEDNLRMDQERINHENRISDLNEKKFNWESQLLRKTTLFPKDQVSGFVYFPYHPYAEYIKFFFPIDNTTITFIFKQDKF